MRRRKAVRQRGTGSILRLPGSRNWYILYRVNGRQIRESSGSPVKQVAVRLLQKRLGEREQGLPPAQGMKRLKYETVRQMVLDDYAIHKRHLLQRHADGSIKLDALPHLDRFFAGRSVANITASDLRQFILQRQGQGAQPSTINRSLALLRKMLYMALDEGLIPKVPKFPMLEENPPRQGFVTHQQFQTLYTFLPDYVQPLVLLLYWTGCRLGEGRKIDWRQVDLDRRQIILQGVQTKNGNPRILPLPGQLVDILRAVPEKQGRVFYQGAFRRSWKHACRMAGLEGLIVHDLRRSAVRNYREAGIAESVIMDISGHRTRSIFERYSIKSDGDIQRAIRQVEHVALASDGSDSAENFDASLIQYRTIQPKCQKGNLQKTHQ